MARSKKNLASLANRPGQTKPSIQGLNTSAASTDVPGQASSSKNPSKSSLVGDIKSISLTAKNTPTGIKFGTPSNRTISSSQSGSEWANLLKQTASGGIASALSGGLGSIGGLGSLISGIVNLFEGGGAKTAQPLVRFNLPASQQQTVYLSSKGSTVYAGNTTESVSAPKPALGIYETTTDGSSPIPSGQSAQYQSTQIVQAVKNALLNSSSLNDIIAEI